MSRQGYGNVYTNSSCYDPGTKRGFAFGPGDPRNGECLLYTTSPAQVETLEHFRWRTSGPGGTTPSIKYNAGITMSLVGGVCGIIAGGILAFYINMVSEDKERRKEEGTLERYPVEYNKFLIGFLVVFIIIMIAMLAVGIYLAVDGRETDADKAARQAKIDAHKASEPQTVFEKIIS